MFVKWENQGVEQSVAINLEELKDQIKSSHGQRRANLISEMNKLEEREVSCKNCPGTCCTFVGNSMQPTIVEAIDLYLHLKENGLWNEELVNRLEKCISDFRLHIRPSTGRGVYMRKSYTCPFFGHQSLGCPISPEVKPYGCLGFNASEKEEDSGKSCSSNLSALEDRERLYQFKLKGDSETAVVKVNEEDFSKGLQETLGLAWHKESIPVALLDLDRVWPK